MARQYQRLNALAVTHAKTPGMYPDGDGLYLQVAPGGSKSWIFRYRLNGRKTPRDMGLGPVRLVGLAEARSKAQEARKLLLEKVDPLEQRQQGRAQRAADAAGTISFRDAAERYIKSKAPGWKNEKHKEQWAATLENYVYPAIGSLPVNLVEVGHVMKILEPIWTVKTETASRVRGRIESVLDWAGVHRYRKGDNPARWKGQLEKLLPAPTRVKRVKHHPALPYKELPGFIDLLRSQNSIGALALEFTILTAARTGEAIGATWDEIDLPAHIWTVPAERIKAGKEHRVPLSYRAAEILVMMREGRMNAFVFPGLRKGKPLSNMAMLGVLKRMGCGHLTTHGFRSTFRDWAAECTSFPSEMAEMALAHTIGNKVEAAYRRGDLFDRRRQMMREFAAYCGSVGATA
ncbi:MAG: integrase arm-type DNA-binding domain-containing protein [Alphaproteobacteria bacterium]|nr:integrase arm-type DNA-binding domain-containing protein [Alphaproteobacteria bacterium]MBU0799083.1 integrase arm-type DNA-binding domain-containing protein [Alphaproteobacteria bacterium]MBU0885585.1 integrase arm-type DNA-binding domain-containing protein [Alphaproteobacteria bacterium]MBU1813760.1 integrase arm-type DNA-binding domain-containing protein [Alphaproteobacteria bacterium]